MWIDQMHVQYGLCARTKKGNLADSDVLLQLAWLGLTPYTDPGELGAWE